MARQLSFSVFDGDNHLYEAKDAFTRHLPERYKRAVQYVEVNGRTKIAIRGQITDFIPNPTFDVVARPGAQEEYFRNGNPEGKSYKELIGEPMRCIPAFREPGARMELMDEQGVDRTLMFPTLASLLEERMRDDPELTHATIHALNQWLHEEWSFDYRDRIFTTPVITLPIVDRAIEELEWVVERGAKVVLIRPAPVPGPRGSRSPALPEFDPFWEKVVESGVLVAMHASDSGYARYKNDWTGPGEYLPFVLDAFQLMMDKERPITDTMTALTCHGLLSRFPDLRILSVENGAAWVLPFLHNLEGVYKKMPQAFAENPIDAFMRCVSVCPFHEDDFEALVDAVGVDRLCFGSDFPHPEGLAEPRSFADHLPPTMSDADKAAIMGGNLGHLMRVGASV